MNIIGIILSNANGKEKLQAEVEFKYFDFFFRLVNYKFIRCFSNDSVSLTQNNFSTLCSGFQSLSYN